MHLAESLPPAAQMLLLSCCAVAAGFDIWWRRIPNWLCGSALLLGILAHTLLWEKGWSGLSFSLEGAGLALLIYLPLYVIRAMGAGDAKFMAALGAIVGPSNWLVVFLATALIGAVLALIVSLSQRKAARTLQNVSFLAAELAHFRAPYLAREELDVKNKRSLTLPHAVSIGLGAAAFLLMLHGTR